MACFIPDIPANLKFGLIKDILVNGDFGISFSMVNEMMESIWMHIYKNNHGCGAANPSEFYDLESIVLVEHTFSIISISGEHNTVAF